MGDSVLSLVFCFFYLLVELVEDCYLDVGEVFIVLLEGCFEDGLVEDVLFVVNEIQCLVIWCLCEDFDVVIYVGVDSLFFDVLLLVLVLVGYVECIWWCLDDLVKGMQVFFFGYFFDGNLYVMFVVDVLLLLLYQVVEEIFYGELGECVGVIFVEYGIGLEKKEVLGCYVDLLKFVLMVQIKELFDFSGLFNLGKVIF